jgi:hypothetical protein
MIVNTPKEKLDPSIKRPVLSEIVRNGMRPILKMTTYIAT